MKILLFIINLFACFSLIGQTYDDYVSDAVNGDPEAQYLLGECFWNGWGVEKNEEYAVNWWIRSAEQNYPISQYALALYYLNLEENANNEDFAMLYLTLSAYNEYPPALYLLGRIYYEADDKAQGMAYLTKAAMLGYKEAENYIKKENTDIVTDKDIELINIKLLEKIADEYSTQLPIKVDYMTQLVKVTMKKREFVYSYIIDEDYIDNFDDLIESRNDLKNSILKGIVDACKINPNTKQMYKAIIQNNVTLVYLYKGSKSNRIMAIKFTPLEIKRKLKL